MSYGEDYHSDNGILPRITIVTILTIKVIIIQRTYCIEVIY